LLLRSARHGSAIADAQNDRQSIMTNPDPSLTVKRQADLVVRASGRATSADGRPAGREGFLDRLCTPPTAQICMSAILLVVFPWAVYRAAGNLACDFPEFVNGGRYILDHGCRHPLTALNRYLPSLDVACILLTIFPLVLSAAIYYLLNVGTWFGLLATVRDELLAGDDMLLRARGTMAAGLLALLIAADGFLIGAFHILMVWMMVAGLAAASRDRPWKGGALLGVAIWLKLLPVVGAGYLVLKRKWLAAGVALLLAVSIDIILSLAAFGWQGSIDEHLVWAAGGAAATVDDQMHGEDAIDEDRITNQSTIVVLRRFLTARGGFPTLAVADLSPTALSLVTGCVLSTLGCAVLMAIRRPAAAMNRRDWSVEIALIVLCTVWFSPVVWSYHLTAVVPALAVILSTPAAEARKNVVSVVWILGILLFAIPLGRAAGHMLWASFFVAASMMLSLHRVTAEGSAAVDEHGLRGPHRIPSSARIE
jgi:hypothetical protein